jgi:hypothetical protein
MADLVEAVVVGVFTLCGAAALTCTMMAPGAVQQPPAATPEVEPAPLRDLALPGRLVHAKAFRAEGNTLIAKQDFRGALQAYQNAVDAGGPAGWKTLLGAGVPSIDPDAVELCEQRVLSASNAMLAMQRLDLHAAVARVGGRLTGLATDSSAMWRVPAELHVKVLFREATSLRASGMASAAVEALESASAVAAGENESVEKALVQLRAEVGGAST